MKYRQPNKEDARMVYEWICDPLTRESSYGPLPESYAAHESWFLNRIAAGDGLYLIFYADTNPQEPIGQVRVDRREEGLVVSIVTAPAHRGKGYASEMLRTMINIHRGGGNGNEPLRAWIMDQNRASRRAFESAGFVLVSSTNVSGFPSGLYLNQ